MTTIPNEAYIIIIGAMRAGTTTLYSLLSQHPQICPCKYKKEPAFFSEKYYQNKLTEKYDQLFDFDEKKHKFVIEASTAYTKYPFEDDVPGKMKTYGISPHFVYIVRDPFKRIESQYNFSVNTNWFKPDSPLYLNGYVSLSCYFTQLEQYRRCFPKKRITIVDFDDLLEDQSQVVDRLYNKFGLQQIVPVDRNTHLNKTSLPSSGEYKLSQITKKIKKLGAIKKASESLPFETKKSLLLLGERIFSMFPDQKTQLKRRVLSEKEKSIIYEKLSDDMMNFEKEYGFDVSKWGFK